MISSKSILPVIIFSVALAIQACSSNEVGESKDVNQDKIYQQYSVHYTEGDPTAKIFSQFRFAGRNGTTLVLDRPSQLTFDGEVIKVDSSKATGAYYQIEKSAAGFFKTHQFVLTDINNKRYENTFSFDAFKLVDIPATISKRQAFKLAFSTTQLSGDDHIEVSTINADSSFSISHAASDAGNFIIIPAEQLKRQKGTTLTLQATLYRSVPLQQSTSEGGHIVIDHTVRPIQIRLQN